MLRFFNLVNIFLLNTIGQVLWLFNLADFVFSNWLSTTNNLLFKSNKPITLNNDDIMIKYFWSLVELESWLANVVFFPSDNSIPILKTFPNKVFPQILPQPDLGLR